MVVLIPARIGSKDVPLKNMRLVGGYPLVLWSVAIARLLGFPIWVSTDSEEIEDVVTKRSFIHHRGQTSDDLMTDTDVVKNFLSNPDHPPPDTIIFLRPTTPFRNPYILKAVIKIFYSHDLYSLRSIHGMTEPCSKMYSENGKPIISKTHDEANAPRQEHKPTYCPNGYIDIFKTDRLSEGLFLEPFETVSITENIIEIDTEENLEYANWWVNKNGHPLLDYMKARLW